MSGATHPSAVRVLDARGVRCPMPVIMLARLAAATPEGGTMVVLWTDPAARTDLPAWAGMRGHTLLGPGDEKAAVAVAAAGVDASADDGVTVVVLTPRP